MSAPALKPRVSTRRRYRDRSAIPSEPQGGEHRSWYATSSRQSRLPGKAARWNPATHLAESPPPARAAPSLQPLECREPLPDEVRGPRASGDRDRWHLRSADPALSEVLSPPPREAALLSRPGSRARMVYLLQPVPRHLRAALLFASTMPPPRPGLRSRRTERSCEQNRRSSLRWRASLQPASTIPGLRRPVAPVLG